jgi:hypothetical protein
VSAHQDGPYRYRHRGFGGDPRNPPIGSVAYEAQRTANGGHLVWIERRAMNRLKPSAVAAGAYREFANSPIRSNELSVAE